MNDTVDHVFDKYLADIRNAATDLPPGLRESILADVRAHIRDATSDRSIDTREEAYQLIAELGDPQLIVTEAWAESEDIETPSPSREVGWALGWLTVGSLIPFAGWIYGLACIWRSPIWTPREKVVALVAYPGGVFGALMSILVIALNSGSACSTSESGTTDVLGGVPTQSVTNAGTCEYLGVFAGWSGPVLMLAVVIVAIAGPTWLAYRAKGRARF